VASHKFTVDLKNESIQIHYQPQNLTRATSGQNCVTTNLVSRKRRLVGYQQQWSPVTCCQGAHCSLLWV